MLVGDKLHFADPSKFNDPLDTQPSLEDDVDDRELVVILRTLIERRISTEMQAGARAMKQDDAKVREWIEQHSQKHAAEYMAEIESSAVYEDDDSEPELRRQLRYLVEQELLRGYEKGIVSLAGRCDCPLMWSHYGDQHRGICLGYSVPAKSAGRIHEVEYRGNRMVKASDVAAMLGGDEEARTRVNACVLLRKAESWAYEQGVAFAWASGYLEFSTRIRRSDFRHEVYGVGDLHRNEST